MVSIRGGSGTRAERVEREDSMIQQMMGADGADGDSEESGEAEPRGSASGAAILYMSDARIRREGSGVVRAPQACAASGTPLVQGRIPRVPSGATASDALPGSSTGRDIMERI